MARDLDFWRSFSPSRDISNSSRRIGRLFNEWLDHVPTSFPDPTFFSEDRPPLITNIKETNDHYILSIDLPGVPKENLNIEVSGNRMTISGERRDDFKSEGIRRRGYEAFQESFILPSGSEASKIEADYRDGVLHIAVPKGSEHKTHKVEIGQGGGFLSKLVNKVGEAISGTSHQAQHSDVGGPTQEDKTTAKKSEPAKSSETRSTGKPSNRAA